MNMKVISIEKRLCTCCMEEHDVKIVQVQEQNIFKDVEVEYEAEYCYCDIADEMYMQEKQIRNNDISMKDAYRKKMGLLTSAEIYVIRSAYGISQSDLCILLGWGGKTLTRYESYQVQDKAHNMILKKLATDPEWFISLLKEAEKLISQEAFQKYMKKANDLYMDNQEAYLRKAIQAKYAEYYDDVALQGNQELSLNKVGEIIHYFAASQEVMDLYKEKLINMLWYADHFSYKLRNHAITGLVYRAVATGAAPVGQELIFNLSEVKYDFTDSEDGAVYQFDPCRKKKYKSLSRDDKEILDAVILKFGKMTKVESSTIVCKEKAYIETTLKNIILYN